MTSLNSKVYPLPVARAIEGPVLQTAVGKTETLTDNPMTAIDIYHTVKRRPQCVGPCVAD